MTTETGAVLALDRLLDAETVSQPLPPNPSWDPTLRLVAGLDQAFSPSVDLQERTWRQLVAAASLPNAPIGALADSVSSSSPLTPTFPVLPASRATTPPVRFTWRLERPRTLIAAFAVLVIAVIGPVVAPSVTNRLSIPPRESPRVADELALGIPAANVLPSFDVATALPTAAPTSPTSSVNEPAPSKSPPSRVSADQGKLQLDSSAIAILRASVNGVDAADLVDLATVGAPVTRRALIAGQSAYERRIATAEAELRATLGWDRWLLAITGSSQPSPSRPAAADAA